MYRKKKEAAWIVEGSTLCEECTIKLYGSTDAGSGEPSEEGEPFTCDHCRGKKNKVNIRDIMRTGSRLFS